MDEETIGRYITESIAGVEVEVATGDAFFFAGSDHRLPFATLVTDDRHDTVSNLSRPSVYRLNIGVGRETFQGLFGAASTSGGRDDAADGYDFAALDRLLPHPVYGPLHWVCVLNPSAATFEVVRPLLAEAHARAAERERKVRPAAEARGAGGHVDRTAPPDPPDPVGVEPGRRSP